MLDSGIDSGYLLVATLPAVMQLAVGWRQAKDRREIREIHHLLREIHRLLQGETQERELLENEVRLLWDKVNRDR